MNVNNSDIFNIYDIQHVKLNMRRQQNTWASKITWTIKRGALYNNDGNVGQERW